MSGTDYISRAKMIERRMAAMREKIKRVYQLTDADLEPDAVTRAEIKTRVEHVMADIWPERRDHYMSEWNISAEFIPGLDIIAEAAIYRYLDAFHLRDVVESQLRSQVNPFYEQAYGNTNAQKNLTNIYINHLCNHTEALLGQLGMNETAAHIMNGSIISRVFDAGGTGILHPQQASADTIPKVRSQVSCLQVYWKEERQNLSTLLGKNGGINR